MNAGHPAAPPRRPPLPDGPYLVVGLRMAGAAVARLLRERDCGEVIGCDTGAPEEAAALDGVEVHLGTEGAELVERAGAVIKSPGVSRSAPVVAAALERGLPVLGELELGWLLLENEFVAVTGTNGKTTTVELLGAIHRAAGVPVEVAGNVGRPVAALVGSAATDAVVVCEASSFQLEDAVAFAPECAVLLNVTEDHLDRHASVEAYREAKLRIFASQGEGDLAVVPAGFGAIPGKARVVAFGEDDDATLALRDGALWWSGERVIGADEIRLRGAHNLENALAASGAALARGIGSEVVAAALREFPGVAHRMEDVAEVAGVLYVNDSKATNLDSALHAIEAFDAPLHLILGGSLKGGGFQGLGGAVAERCRACYLIGEAADRIAADLAGAVPLRRCDDLARAVEQAAAAAEPGEVVLLSPACASYDQFRDFEQRGERFRALVGEL